MYLEFHKAVVVKSKSIKYRTYFTEFVHIIILYFETDEYGMSFICKTLDICNAGSGTFSQSSPTLVRQNNFLELQIRGRRNLGRRFWVQNYGSIVSPVGGKLMCLDLQRLRVLVDWC